MTETVAPSPIRPAACRAVMTFMNASPFPRLPTRTPADCLTFLNRFKRGNAFGAEQLNHGEHGEKLFSHNGHNGHNEKQKPEPLTTEAQRHREKQEKNKELVLTFSVSLCFCG
jgi:hypothetical protein